MGMAPWGTYDANRPGRLLERIFDDPWHLVANFAGRDLPPVEVFEQPDEVVVRAEVAGIDPQDVEVRLTDDTLTLRGDRRNDAPAAAGYYRSERQYGSFARTVSLPVPVDPTKARASFRHGLLEIRAPKREDDNRSGRRIDIEVP